MLQETLTMEAAIIVTRQAGGNLQTGMDLAGIVWKNRQGQECQNLILGVTIVAPQHQYGLTEHILLPLEKQSKGYHVLAILEEVVMLENL